MSNDFDNLCYRRINRKCEDIFMFHKNKFSTTGVDLAVLDQQQEQAVTYDAGYIIILQPSFIVCQWFWAFIRDHLSKSAINSNIAVTISQLFYCRQDLSTILKLRSYTIESCQFMY